MFYEKVLEDNERFIQV